MIRYLLLLVVFIVALVFGSLVAVYNGHYVDFNYHFGAIELPLVLLLFVSLVLGCLIGVVAMAVAWMKAARRAAKFRRQLNKSKQEVENLRKLPLHESY